MIILTQNLTSIQYIFIIYTKHSARNSDENLMNYLPEICKFSAIPTKICCLRRVAYLKGLNDVFDLIK